MNGQLALWTVDTRAVDALDRAIQGKRGQRTDLVDNVNEVERPTGNSEAATVEVKTTVDNIHSCSDVERPTGIGEAATVRRLPKVRLVSFGRQWMVPSGFTCRDTPRHCSYGTPDGRWVIEANWWDGGYWCVFDLADGMQRAEADQQLRRQYYEPGISYCEQPIPTDTGVIVRNLEEAREIIAAGSAATWRVEP